MPRRDDYDNDDEYDDRPRSRRDDRRYDDEEYDDYDDYDRPRRRRGGRSAALQKVAMPAIFMMILGGIGLAFAVVRTIIDLTMDDDGANAFGGPPNPAMKDLKPFIMIIGPILNVIWGLIVLFGGLQMKSLKNRGFVLFSCIWAMLPCSACCILGIPFGIWGLVAIGDENVKRSFAS